MRADVALELGVRVHAERVAQPQGGAVGDDGVAEGHLHVQALGGLGAGSGRSRDLERARRSAGEAAEVDGVGAVQHPLRGVEEGVVFRGVLVDALGGEACGELRAKSQRVLHQLREPRAADVEEHLRVGGVHAGHHAAQDAAERDRRRSSPCCHPAGSLR